MSNKALKIILGSAIVLTGVGIVAYFTRQAKLLAKSCYTMAGVIIQEISFNNVKFTLLLNVKNKSEIPFTVKNQRYKVYVNGLLVSEISQPEKTEIEGNSAKILKLDVEFNPQDLLRAGITNIEPLLYDKNRLIIDLKGYMAIQSGLVTVNNYEVSEKMSLKELMTTDPDKEDC